MYPRNMSAEQFSDELVKRFSGDDEVALADGGYIKDHLCGHEYDGDVFSGIEIDAITREEWEEAWKVFDAQNKG